MADTGKSLKEQMPQSSDASKHIAGLSPGVKAGGFLFLSGIRGRDPKTREFSDNTREQARRAFKNLEALLTASGATLAHVVKVTVYLHDLELRLPFHEIWMEFFPVDPPARIVVCVADANADPSGNAHFALDVIALAP